MRAGRHDDVVGLQRASTSAALAACPSSNLTPARFARSVIQAMTSAYSPRPGSDASQRELAAEAGRTRRTASRHGRARRRCVAACRPAGPAPTTTTRRRVAARGDAPAGFALVAELRVVDLGQRLADVDLAPGEVVVARRADVGDAARARLCGPVRIGDQARASVRRGRRRRRRSRPRLPPASRCGRSPSRACRPRRAGPSCGCRGNARAGNACPARGSPG